MTDWENFGPGRNGPYQKIRVATGKNNSRVIRICNRCGILYVQKDFNAGYCPNQMCFNGRPQLLELRKETQDRQEETA